VLVLSIRDHEYGASLDLQQLYPFRMKSTVSRGTERLRLTPTPLHSDEQIDRLVAALKEIWSRRRMQERVARSPASHNRESH
jgi:hypothetical protein